MESEKINTDLAFKLCGCGDDMPPIYVYADEDGDAVAEWIFDEFRFVLTACNDGKKLWAVVSKTISASGEF